MIETFFLCAISFTLGCFIMGFGFNKVLERNIELQKEILDLMRKIKELEDE